MDLPFCLFFFQMGDQQEPTNNYSTMGVSIIDEASCAHLSMCPFSFLQVMSWQNVAVSTTPSKTLSRVPFNYRSSIG